MGAFLKWGGVPHYLPYPYPYQVMMNPKFQKLATKMMANPELMAMMQDPAMLQQVARLNQTDRERGAPNRQRERGTKQTVREGHQTDSEIGLRV